MYLIYKYNNFEFGNKGSILILKKKNKKNKYFIKPMLRNRRFSVFIKISEIWILSDFVLLGCVLRFRLSCVVFVFIVAGVVKW